MGEAYDIIAALMRYVFLLLLLYFVVTLIIRSVSEYRYLKQAQRILQLSIRYIEILSPERYKGITFRLSEKNTLGTAEDADIRLFRSMLKPHHARIDLQKGEYRFSTKKKRHCEINGQPVIRKWTALADRDTVWVEDVCFVCRKNKTEVEKDA